eukprot:gene7351-9365_t
MFPQPKVQDTLKTIIAWLHKGFDATATWVTQLSWWKFFLFAALALIAGSILQDELFSSRPDEEYVTKERKRSRPGGDTNILIDDSGIHFNPRGSKIRKETPPAGAEEGSEPAAPALPEPPAPAEPPEAAAPPEAPAAPAGSAE